MAVSEYLTYAIPPHNRTVRLFLPHDPSGGQQEGGTAKDTATITTKVGKLNHEVILGLIRQIHSGKPQHLQPMEGHCPNYCRFKK